MRSLFLKSLTIIVVTVVGTLVAVTVVLNALQTSPLAAKLAFQERQVVLDLTRATLQQDGAAAAEAFVRTSEATRPTGLSVTTVDDPTCARPDTAETRTVGLADGCYRVTVEPPASVVPFRFAPIVLGLTILISSVVSAGLLARNVVSPVAVLREGLSALANGRYDHRTAGRLKRRRDEIATLAMDFDRTAARLQDHRDTQQRLFHDVSHELRSPLSRMQAASGILRKTPAKLDAMLDRIDREIARLDRLIGEVLTLARTSGQAEHPITLQRLDVIEILNQILADAAFEAQSRGVTITDEIPGEFPADMDGELIYRALENVIRNATKYTRAGTAVAVSCASSPERLTVEITDQGPGVAASDLDRIFQPFCRGTSSEDQTGHGLGLAIARHAIDAHGGSIRADHAPDGGLRVTLTIPRHPEVASHDI
mgnify:CR=1 FL=1